VRYFVIGLVAVFGAINGLAKDEKKARPCRNIVKACKEAGFLGAKKGKGHIYRDCVEKIIKGEMIEGVNVDPADVQACLNKKKQ